MGYVPSCRKADDGTDFVFHLSECNGNAPEKGSIVTFDISPPRIFASNIQGCTGAASGTGGGKGKSKAAGGGQDTVKSHNPAKGKGFVLMDRQVQQQPAMEGTAPAWDPSRPHGHVSFAIFLGEVKFFCQDTGRDVRWLLKAAVHCKLPLRGTEEVPNASEDHELAAV